MNKKIAVIAGAVGTVLTAVLTVKHIKNTSYADSYKAVASDSMEYAETVMTGFCEDIKAVTKPVFDRHNALTVSKNNFPDIVQHGNVFDGDYTQFKGYDLLLGGSPCTYWSVAKKNRT